MKIGLFACILLIPFAFCSTFLDVPDISFVAQLRSFGHLYTATEIERHTYLVSKVAELPIDAIFPTDDDVFDLEEWYQQNIDVSLLSDHTRIYAFLVAWLELICQEMDLQWNFGREMDQQLFDSWFAYQRSMRQLIFLWNKKR